MDCKRGDVERIGVCPGPLCNVALASGHLEHFSLTSWDLVNIYIPDNVLRSKPFHSHFLYFM
ncbi:hypothetical protein N7449_003270 [Penicillium cf. viridicatum]|uniref:Uncharacterized protein n=1 Tax=Penicillium cf. viridicatum TaxID=2972119 RepID=A0A9W9MWQ3_9EURO|nr:hypothetical protein N7449_003270 [Penicillium cf. viridicatum]